MNAALASDLAEDLIRRGFESPDLEYKKDFDDSTGAWMELAKDVYGIANYGGGDIVLGVEDGTFVPVGLDEGFKKDTQDWIDRVSKWATGRISLTYLEHIATVDGKKRKFPILRIHGSVGSLIIPKNDGNYVTTYGETKTAFKLGLIYTRRNTSTVPVTGDEFWHIFWGLLQRTAERDGGQSTPLEVISALSKKAEPDALEETLWFNLFPVMELPDFIHVVDTEYRYPLDIYEKINGEIGSGKAPDFVIPPFMLLDKKIYSFSPFDESNPLELCMSRSNPSISTKQWLDDPAQHQKLVMLLNYNLKALCRKKGFFHDKRRDRFFMRYFGGPVPEITWKPYKRTSMRQLVTPRVDSQGQLVYCEHFGGRIRFMVLGSGVYLVIEPIRVLTDEGEYPLDQRRNVRISTRKNFYYHNNNYLYEMKLWLHILAGNSKEILLGTGSGTITVSVLPLNVKADFGVSDDQYTSEDFLDSLKSEPFEYAISYEETEQYNPLTETSLEE
jgi:hypothetical protein